LVKQGRLLYKARNRDSGGDPHLLWVSKASLPTFPPPQLLQLWRADHSCRPDCPHWGIGGGGGRGGVRCNLQAVVLGNCEETHLCLGWGGRWRYSGDKEGRKGKKSCVPSTATRS